MYAMNGVTDGWFQGDGVLMMWYWQL